MLFRLVCKAFGQFLPPIPQIVAVSDILAFLGGAELIFDCIRGEAGNAGIIATICFAEDGLGALGRR